VKPNSSSFIFVSSSTTMNFAFQSTSAAVPSTGPSFLPPMRLNFE
jgi:hypothetical protein